MRRCARRQLNLESVTEAVNDEHMQPWSEMCRKANIQTTPLSPYLDKELLYNNSLGVDGTKIEQTGFKYEVPRMTKALVLEVIKGFQDQKLFPPCTLFK